MADAGHWITVNGRHVLVGGDARGGVKQDRKPSNIVAAFDVEKERQNYLANKPYKMPNRLVRVMGKYNDPRKDKHGNWL